MSDYKELGLPPDPPARTAPRPAAPAPGKGSKKGPKGTKKSKTVALKPWVITPSASYSYGVPSPIWHESHGFHVGGIFQHRQLLNGFGIGLEYEQRSTARPISATDRLSRVKGKSHTGHLVLQRETFSSGLLSKSSTLKIGIGPHSTSQQTLYTQDGGSVTVDGKSALGITLTSLTEPLNIHAITNWLSFSPFLGISVTDAKGSDFDGMRLLLGLNVRFSLGPKNTKTVSTDKKQKPGWFVFGHDLFSHGFKLTHQYLTSRLSNDYETIQRDINLSGGAPGNLTYLQPIKLLNGALTIFNQGGEMERYFAYDDGKGWGYLALMGAGAAYMFGKGTASKTIGISSLAQVGRMLIFMPLRTPTMRDAMDAKKKKKEAFKALMGSFALDFGAALLGSIIIGAGQNTELSRGMLMGSTLSQGGLTFTNIPGIKSSTAAQYMLMYYFGSDGTKGLLGGALLRKHFRGLNLGLETTVATSTLAGNDKKNGKFREKPLPSFICVSPGYQIEKKNFHLHVGPNQCFREGGNDGITGSIGAQLSVGGHVMLGSIKKTKISLTGSLTASGGWNFGGIVPDKPKNSGYGMLGASVGLRFD